MILVGVGDDDGEKILAVLLEEPRIRQHQIDPRQIGGRERDATIDGDPLATVGPAEAVQRQIHADLAHAPERSENEFSVRSARHRCQSPRVTLVPRPMPRHRNARLRR